MSKLAVKTKGNASPQGKPRVYFSCHPDDFKLHFETLCGDIFKTQDCAIYYESEWDAPADPEELEGLLSQMQLFVVPITSRFLFRECRAKFMEYGFAMEHHIPIIPILVEGSLDGAGNDLGLSAGAPVMPSFGGRHNYEEIVKRLNRVKSGYGDIQFLDRASTDPTEIPYAEKLEKILSSILIGDKLAERVRAAFDAQIFLSYRKKDRKHAQDLMRLIHRIPFCRDVAIWYDEFLNPGEDWRDEIAQALAKSDLATLAVTPNLTEPGNYIIKHEYPNAVGLGKTVIPTKLLPTDAEDLRRLFPGISDAIDARDEAALTEALEDALRDVALRSNDTPEHDYLIGRAYLGGIDVERDPERALSLIAGAAERDLPEAMTKLADMYQNGEGVAWDYEASVAWLEKLLEVRRRLYSDALVKLGDKFLRLGRDFFDGRGEVLIGEVLIGEVLSFYGRDACAGLNRAKECYEELRQLAEASRSLAARKDLLNSYRSLGDIARMEGKLSEARNNYEKALEIRKALVEELWAAYYRLLGAIAREEGKLSETRNNYEEALEIEAPWAVSAHRELAANYRLLGDIARGKGDLLDNYRLLGDIARGEGDLSEAKDKYEKALEIRKALTGRAIDGRRELAANYRLLGDIARGEGDLSEARDNYEKALEISKAITEEAGDIDARRARRELAADYRLLGDIARGEGKLSEARDNYEKALEIRKALAEETRSSSARMELAESYACLGGAAQAEGNTAEARVFFKKGLEINEVLAKTQASSGRLPAQMDLYISYRKLCDIAQMEDNPTEAKEWREKAQTIRQLLVKRALAILQALGEEFEGKRRPGDFLPQKSLVDGYSHLDKAVQAQEIERVLVGKDKKWYEKYLEINRLLAGYERHAEYERYLEMKRALAEKPLAWGGLAATYADLGDAAQALGNLAEAQDYFEKALEIRKALAEKMKKTRKGLARIYNKLGNVAYAQGKLVEALGWFEKELEVHKALAEEAENSQSRIPERKDLADSYAQLGAIAQAAGNPEEARGWFEKELEVHKALAEEAEDPRSRILARRDLADSYAQLGAIAQAAGNPEEAHGWFEKELEINKSLAEEAEGPRSRILARRDLADSYTHLGNTAQEAGNLAEAKRWHKEAQAIHRADCPPIWSLAGRFENFLKLCAFLRD